MVMDRSSCTKKLGLLLSLLWSLVDSQTVPYVSFRGETLLNHSYVDLSLVGDAEDGSDSVQCHTDLTSCCTSGLASDDRPDWYFPDGNGVGFMSGGGDIYQDRGAHRNDLRRRNNALPPSGIYRCEIPTDDDDGGFERKTVYVGIYGSGGDIVISGDVSLTVNSDLNGASPQFTLTCISTGGPATTVTWTRNSVTITGGTETVLDNPETAQYTHTLTGSTAGEYTCTVTNNKPSTASASYTIPATDPPTNVMAVQDGLTSVLVSWNPSSNATGYIISYNTGHSSGRVAISGGSIDSHFLFLQNRATYSISIVATSQELPSDAVVIDVTLGSSSTIFHSNTDITGAVIGGVAIGSFTTAVIVIVVVVIVSRACTRDARAQKRGIHTSSNEAYNTVSHTGGTTDDETVSNPRTLPPSTSSQPTTGDYEQV